jgi:hypothetical protein
MSTRLVRFVHVLDVDSYVRRGWMVLDEYMRIPMVKLCECGEGEDGDEGGACGSACGALSTSRRSLPSGFMGGLAELTRCQCWSVRSFR